METNKKSLLNHKFFNTTIKSANVKFKEIVFGYLLGPFGGLIANAVFMSFLNTYYTDVLGMTGKEYGLYLTLLPLLSTIFIVIGNLLMGRLIDRTKTARGKARPYLILSAPLMALTCVLMFVVPSENPVAKMILVAVSYNLFFAFAYPMYFVAHSMMVPLSTRNLKQRGILSVVVNMANLGAVGMFSAMVFPMMIYPALKNQTSWLIAMSVIAVFVFGAIVLQYYFTRERISEESDGLDTEKEKIPLKRQLKAVLGDKYWWIIIIFYLLFQFSGAIKNLSMVYFCNYIVGTYKDGFTQTLLALLGGIPLALAVAFVWPLAKRFGKNTVTLVGMAVGVAGSFIALINPTNFALVAAGIALKSLGAAPATYVMMALFADVLDHLECKNGFRSDGLSMSVYSILMVASIGICTGIFNAMLTSTGYVPPVGDIAQAQPAAAENAIIVSYIWVELVAYAAIVLLLIFMRVEKNIASEQKQILERRKALTLANGGEWVESEEKARLEQEQFDREAEESRKAELKAYCERKGLSYEAEESKYQSKTAAACKKAEEKAAKRKSGNTSG
jgi:GPH family glycoside/pentoside/hexuronide:cation symporter